MTGINPVTGYNPTLYAPQQQAVVGYSGVQNPVATGFPQQGLNTVGGTVGGEQTDLQKILAESNALAVEGTTVVAPKVIAIAQETEKLKSATKANEQLQQQNLALKAQIQAASLKGQQQGIQGNALQQLEATMPTATLTPSTGVTTVPTGVPSTATTVPTPSGGMSQDMVDALSSGNLGQLGKATVESALSGKDEVFAALEKAKLVGAYKKALIANGIPADQAQALAEQQVTAEQTGQQVAVAQPQQPVVVPNTAVVPQQLVAQPVVQQPSIPQDTVLQQPTVLPAQVQPQVQPQVLPVPTATTGAGQVNIPGVGLVDRSILAGLLQNTTPEAVEAQAQQQALLQQQQQQVATATPRSILPTVEPTPTTLMPAQPVATVGTPSPFVLSPLPTLVQPTVGGANTLMPTVPQANTSVTQQADATTVPQNPAEARYQQSLATLKAQGQDISTMPATLAERDYKRRKKHQAIMAKFLKPPKLYVPKADDNKYAYLGGADDA